MLSNNHVFAHSNRAKIGDVVLQPGPTDGGRYVRNVAGSLFNYVPIRRRGNLLDAALADIDPLVEPQNVALPGIGPVAGWWTGLPQVSQVRKVGRTTGLTHGRISALNLRNLPVDYDGTLCWFDSVLEVQGRGSTPVFSDGGDSGSLVVDADRMVVGLLFAGDDDATYLNQIGLVLDAFNVQLIC